MRTRRVSVPAIVAAALIAIFSVPLFLLTCLVVQMLARQYAAPASTFFVEGWLGPFELICASTGPAAVVLIVLGICSKLRNPSSKMLLYVLPIAFAIELWSMVTIPDLALGRESHLNLEHLFSLEQRLNSWRQSRGRFPLSRIELRSAVSDVETESSPYRLGSARLSFEAEFVPNQSGPYQTVPKRPGIVYYAVSQDGRRMWLTVSGLNSPCSDRPAMEEYSAIANPEEPWGNLLVVSGAGDSDREIKPR